jgi:hypothetical protein
MYFLPDYDPRQWMRDALKCLTMAGLICLFLALAIVIWATAAKG